MTVITGSTEWRLDSPSTPLSAFSGVFVGVGIDVTAGVGTGVGTGTGVGVIVGVGLGVTVGVSSGVGGGCWYSIVSTGLSMSYPCMSMTNDSLDTDTRYFSPSEQVILPSCTSLGK